MNTRPFRFNLFGTDYTLDIEDEDTSECVAAEIVEGRSYPIYDWMRDEPVRPIQSIVDVGANVGVFSFVFGQLFPDATIYAYEPDAETFDVLTRNIAGRKAWCHRVAVSDSSGKACLYMNSVGGSLMRTIRACDGSVHSEVETVDANVALPERVDILKLDIEGMEMPVLRSIADRLSDIPYIYTEYHTEEDRLQMDMLLLPTHRLWYSRGQHPDLGETLYVRRKA
jgi:FkbM family methyltransferase